MIKKIFGFLLGLILMALTLAMLWLAGAIYDTSKRLTVDTYFFQPAPLAQDRMETPLTPEQLGPDTMRRMLVERFVTEYFYVIPDTADVQQRMKGGMLAKISSGTVYDKWLSNTAQQISQMASDGQLRTVRVTDMSLPADGQYWTVHYEMLTWTKPNDFSVAPTFSRGTMFIDLIYEPGFRPTQYRGGPKLNIGRFLDNGGDPALIFKIMINNVDFAE